VRAFWPKRAVAVYGNSPADAMAQMQACIAILGSNPDIKIETDIGDSRLISVYDASNGMRMAGGPMPPVAAHAALLDTKNPAEWEDPVEVTGDLEAPEAPEDGDVPLGDVLIADDSSPSTTASVAKLIERINGVAIDGAIAFAEGTPAGDCPYSSEDTGKGDEEDESSDEYTNFIRWNEEWDAAADAKSDEEEEGKGGSVVSAKYRAKYAEAGHPTHCGDWLAETLNEICLNKEGVNLELFEGICALNGVDTSKYKRSGVGWQGRIRMTGRNLMSKRVFLNDGKLILPESMGGFKQAPEDWMAVQRFKALPKAEQK
jgi:hypothetical protein